MTKKIFFFIVFALIAGATYSQKSATKFVVKFKDKNNSPYSLSNPSAFLSAKAITRRAIQNISLKPNDLPVNPAYIDSVRNAGATVITKSKWMNCVIISNVTPTIMAKINSLPFVLQVDSVAKTNKGRGKNEITNSTPKKKVVAVADNQGTKNTSKEITTYNYGSGYNQIHMLCGDALHSQGYDGAGMTIAVLDAGFQNADTMKVFDSLWVRGQIQGTKDFVNPGGNVFAPGISTHGMMVLSTMGGNLPGQLVGTAPKAKYWLIRTEDAPSEFFIEEYNWASGAEFADSVGADVINSSLGYTVFDDGNHNHTYGELDGNTGIATIAADLAASKGILVVNSAGNSGNSPWHFIGIPADGDSVLTIGAVDAAGSFAAFSSFGPTSDGRIKPNVMSQGEQSVVASPYGGGVVTGNGTSFSSPIMAGMVACLWQANPTLGNMQIIDAIQKSATLFNNPNDSMGYGIPNFCVANLLLSGLPIHDFDKEGVVNVFPSPFKNNIYLVFNSTDTQTVNIEMFDITGRSVYNKLNQTRNIGINYYSIDNIGNLAKGFYVVRLSSKNKVYSTKVMKD
ncbi:MAG: S8 family peptidase [Bacteroidetes bacterium]|nr:S8 family peptidase [Bacteroidota bacterium]